MLKCLTTRVDCSSFVPRGNGRTHTPTFSVHQLHGFRSADRRDDFQKKFSRKTFLSNDRERCDFGAKLSGDGGWHLAGMFLSSLFERKGHVLGCDPNPWTSLDFLNFLSLQKASELHVHL
jgi:hypothetical protein